MRLPVTSTSGLIALLVAIALPCVGDGLDNTALLDLPSAGRTAAIAVDLAQGLARQGLIVKDGGPEALGDNPALAVLYSGRDYSAEQLQGIRSYVEAGGGVVLILGTASRLPEATLGFLAAIGLQVDASRRSSGDAHPADHPAARGAGDFPDTSMGLALSGEKLQGVVTQGDSVVAGAVEHGAGRVVVIPARLVTTPGDAPPAPGQTQLLVGSCLWVDRLAATRGPAETEAQGPTREGRGPSWGDEWERPLGSVVSRRRYSAADDFSGTILVDLLAGDNNWETLADELDRVLDGAGLPVRYLDVQSTHSPLLAALQSSPALLVLGATRRFTLDEAISVRHYVQTGGRLWAIGHADPGFQVRLIDVNLVLREFGVTVSLIRPEGATLLQEHEIGKGVAALPPMAWGIGVWSAVVPPVAKAGTTPFLGAGEVGDGRIAVMDGKVLLVGTSAMGSTADSAGPRPFSPLASRTLDWLLQIN